MLFQIENWYCHGLKISEPQVHQIKESNPEELKAAIYQKVVLLVLLSTFKNMVKIVSDHIWKKKPS